LTTVLITGCSSGFGKASAVEFARAGHHVYATMRNTAACSEIQVMAQQEQLKLDVLPLDVTDKVQMKSTITEIIDRTGRLDVLINNAGIAMPAALEDLSDADLDYVMKVNFFAPVHLSRAVLPQMRKQKYGRIIMLSSLSALLGLPGESMYSASKSALEAVAEGLRHEVERFNVYVSVIEPGLFNTGMPDKIAGSFICPPDSPYTSLIKHLQKSIKAGIGKGDDPLRVAELLIEIVKDEKPAFRYPAGEQAEEVVPAISQLTDEARQQFIREVNDTAWWSGGNDKPEKVQ